MLGQQCCDRLGGAGCKCWANNVVICYTEMLGWFGDLWSGLENNCCQWNVSMCKGLVTKPLSVTMIIEGRHISHLFSPCCFVCSLMHSLIHLFPHSLIPSFAHFFISLLRGYIYLVDFISKCLVLYKRKRVFHHLTDDTSWSCYIIENIM